MYTGKKMRLGEKNNCVKISENTVERKKQLSRKKIKERETVTLTLCIRLNRHWNLQTLWNTLYLWIKQCDVSNRYYLQFTVHHHHPFQRSWTNLKTLWKLGTKCTPQNKNERHWNADTENSWKSHDWYMCCNCVRSVEHYNTHDAKPKSSCLNPLSTPLLKSTLPAHIQTLTHLSNREFFHGNSRKLL